MSSHFDPQADRYAHHSTTLRGVVRNTLVARQLAMHLPPSPASIVDVGGGAGNQAIPLARDGYDVTLLDPSEEMLRRARDALIEENAIVRRRVRLVQGSGKRQASSCGTSRATPFFATASS